MLRWAVFAWILAAGCGDASHELIVDLRSDMSPGVEFDNTRLELRDERGRLGEIVRTSESAAISSHDYVSGRRVAELVGLATGDYTLIAELSLEGAPVVEVLVPIALSSNRAVTVLVTGACAGRTCPMAGDDPTAVGCLYGSCVDPACLLGGGSSCGSPSDAGPMDGDAGDAGVSDSDVGPTDSAVDGDATIMDAGADTAVAPVECGALPPYFYLLDNCQNPRDMPLISRIDFGAMMDQTLEELTASCGSTCISSPDIMDCATACVMRRVADNGGSVSAPCAACYAGLSACDAQLCPSSCLADPDGPACASCRAGMNMCDFECIDGFLLCTGIGFPPP